MKKLLLMIVGAICAFPVMAQDAIGDDVTKYIINAGFDEDLTFQVDGTMKEAATTNTSLSGRSWAYICADSTVYARPKSTSSQNRSDGKKMKAVNGFFGHINGWNMKLTSTYPNCEWTYFGTIPYGLGAEAVPKSDDTNAFIPSPSSKPTTCDTPENLGCLYINAGWGNSASYVQNVSLPCAKYKLEYWTININPNASVHATDLTQIICRRDVFKAESSDLSASTWTKHEFEFTPTDKFTIQFGVKSADGIGSGNQEVICIDGIKLTKIDEAQEDEILRADIQMYYIPELETVIYSGDLDSYSGAVAELQGVLDDLYTVEDSEDLDVLRDAAAAAKAALAKAEKLAEVGPELDSLIGDAEAAAATTDYPGKSALATAINNAANVSAYGTCDEIEAAIAVLQEAIMNYYFSQSASEESPADYTFMIKNPWFIKSSAITFDADGNPIYPNANGDANGENIYSNGSSNVDLTSEGWYIGQDGSDQRLNWVQGRSCWNAWGSNFNQRAIFQDLTGLPTGYYKVSADLITQPGYATNQHVLAVATLDESISPFLTVEGWNADDPTQGVWTTLTTEKKILVVDGKLTIGAEGNGSSDTGSAGWFCATNFKLLFLGAASQEEMDNALSDRVAAVVNQSETMHFAGDKAKVDELLAQYQSEKDLEFLTEAANLATTSEEKYAAVMGEDAYVTTVANTLAGTGYGAANEIAQYAYNQALTWMASEVATYAKVDSVINHVKSYIDVYVPAYNEAAGVAENTSSETVKTYLGNLMLQHKIKLTSAIQPIDDVQAMADELTIAINMAGRQEQFDADPNATDYTGFIINPAAESEVGWTLDKGTGDKNTTSGQYYNSNDATHRYFDSYNSTEGALNFYGEQLVVGVPNGTYTLGADVRTSGEGAFIFGANITEEKNDTLWCEIPLQTYEVYNDETMQMEPVNATDKYGAIWEAAVAAFQSMLETDPNYFTTQGIVNANAGNGFGWEHVEIPGIVVTDHKILIGMTTDSVRTGKPFTGKWFSVTNWTLTLTNAGDNSGWTGPMETGIEEISIVGQKAVDGIYTINGQRLNRVNRPGLYIVVRNGKAMKVLMK